MAPLDLEVEDLGGCARRVPVRTGAGAELSDRAGYLWWDEEPLIAVDEISLPGAHNRANAMAAAAACLARGIDADAVAAGLRTFPGVAHRLELIATRDGVAFVNDSKATNVASTLVALRSYPGGVHLIAGGRRQAPGLLAAGPAGRRALPRRVPDRRGGRRPGRGPGAGAACPCISSRRPRRAPSPRPPRPRAPGDTVLLSPACASYDQYPDFEARGDHFRALVEEL